MVERGRRAIFEFLGYRRWMLRSAEAIRIRPGICRVDARGGCTPIQQSTNLTRVGLETDEISLCRNGQLYEPNAASPVPKTSNGERIVLKEDRSCQGNNGDSGPKERTIRWLLDLPRTLC